MTRGRVGPGRTIRYFRGHHRNGSASPVLKARTVPPLMNFLAGSRHGIQSLSSIDPPLVRQVIGPKDRFIDRGHDSQPGDVKMAQICYMSPGRQFGTSISHAFDLLEAYFETVSFHPIDGLRKCLNSRQ